MKNFNKLRGILSAKKGTQVPKFQNPSGTIGTNPQIIAGAGMTKSFETVTRPADIGQRKLPELPGKQTFGEKNPGMSNFLNIVGNAAPQLMSTGFDMLGNYYNKNVTNSNGVDTAFKVGDSIADNIGTINPMLGVAAKAGMTALKGINDITGKKTSSFSINQDVVSKMGGAYSGSIDKFSEAENYADTKMGGFSAKERKKREKLIAQATKDQQVISDINADVETQRARINPYTSEQYRQQLEGGINFNYIRSHKQGTKLQTKIDFIKERKTKFNSTINIDSKEIEFIPEILDGINSFKEGGIIDTIEEWIPVIITEEWQPIIEDTIIQKVSEFKEGGNVILVEDLEKVKENKPSFEEWFNSIPEHFRASGYDYKKAYEVFDWEELRKHAENPVKNHLRSASPIADEEGKYPFLKLGHLEENPELQGEFNWYNSKDGKEHKSKFDIKYIGDRYYYVPKKLKNGGSVGESDISEIEKTTQKNIIPEGALHKNKHHIEHTEGLTQKGIPVVDNNGNQQAEVECEEIIFTLEVTKALEERYHKYYSDDTTQKEKDELAIEVGKLLVKEILYNTDDRVQLIDKCKEGGKL